MKNLTIACVLNLIMAFSSSLLAENIAISVAEQGNPSVSAPSNGQKMQDVESQYGEPLQRAGSVGDPAITKWVYQAFTVYFENETVLHSVIHRS